MRPTMLMFRSPKERTPEFYAPKVLNDGSILNINKSKNTKKKYSSTKINTTLPKQKRFRDYRILSRITSK